MKTSILVRTAAVCFALFPVVAIATEDAQALDQLLTKKVIRVRDVKKLPGPIHTGDGPVLWTALDQKKVAWFWFIPGPAAAMGEGRIRLIATGDLNDENHATIVWPKSKVGHDYGAELRAIYKDR